MRTRRSFQPSSPLDTISPIHIIFYDAAKTLFCHIREIKKPIFHYEKDIQKPKMAKIFSFLLFLFFFLHAVLHTQWRLQLLKDITHSEHYSGLCTLFERSLALYALRTVLSACHFGDFGTNYQNFRGVSNRLLA
jgi:hypothetical protein